MAKRFKFYCPFWLAEMERQEELIKRKLLQRQRERTVTAQPPQPLAISQPAQFSLSPSMIGTDLPLMQIPLQVSNVPTVMEVDLPIPRYQNILPRPSYVSSQVLAIPGTSTSNDHMLPSSQKVSPPTVTDLKCAERGKHFILTVRKARKTAVREPPKKIQKKDYACEYCDFSTNDKYHLKNHIKKNHMDILEAKKKAAEPKEPLLTCTKIFYCQFCGVKTKVSEFMDWHYKNCHGDDAVAEVLEFEDKPIRFRCKPCNKTYKELQFLAPHLSIRHNVNLPFECDICHEYFITRNKLTIHKLEIHEGSNFFKCDKCPSKFIRECDLKLHVFKEHVLEKAEHQCDICGKAFKTEANLIYHIGYYHKNERPFECDKCDKTFRRKCDLNRHIDLVHITKQRKEKAFPCDLCDKSFTSSLGRYSHKRLVHGLFIENKVYACEYCEATFNRAPYYRQHVKVNHTNKLLKCEECDFLTRSNDSLNLHIKKRHPYLNHEEKLPTL